MPTSGSDHRYQSSYSHEMPAAPAATTRRVTPRPVRARRARRSAPRTGSTAQPRWKVATEVLAADTSRPPTSGALALLEEPATLPQAQSRPTGARQTILIVEDDPRVAGVIRESLELEGDAEWVVETASDGLRALELAGSTPPDVVLLDVRLPDLDGAEVYRRLRAGQQTRAARVLFLTAGTSFDLHQRGIEDGVLLRKPFDVRDLVGIVRALLAG